MIDFDPTLITSGPDLKDQAQLVANEYYITFARNTDSTSNKDKAKQNWMYIGSLVNPEIREFNPEFRQLIAEAFPKRNANLNVFRLTILMWIEAFRLASEKGISITKERSLPNSERMEQIASAVISNQLTVNSEQSAINTQPIADKSPIGIDYNNNKLAEKILKDLYDNDRQPTETELAQLRQFSGYGGMEKMGATGKGLLYEYYTPEQIVLKMWELAYLYGYKNGDMLEPSVGVGRFLEYAPKTARVLAYETNPTSAKICSLLYPNAEVILGEFEKRFIKNNDTVRGKVTPEFDLVMGNCPYGEMGGVYAGMGEKSYTHAQNYIDYFITRGLDCLHSGGLLIMIIGAEVSAGGKPWLMQETDTKAKQDIAAKADLLDAYRLPNGVFDRTDVVSEIVVFRKK